MVVMILLNQNRAPLFEAMKEYHKRDVVPFDVPGHKHGLGIKEMTDYFGSAMLELDVNAMKSLDNICNPRKMCTSSKTLNFQNVYHG